MKAARVFQLTALLLVAVSVVQVGWWILDQREQAVEKVRVVRGAYAEQAAAAQALLDAGVSAQRVQQLLPQIVVADGHAALAPQVEEAMVTQILEGARLERGRVEFKSEPLELGAAVARVVAHLEERARQERIRISCDIEPGLYVVSDPLALDVVVRNILENALAAVTPLGGGSIALSARALNGEVELSVRDSGVGFRPADGARLFERFTRLHPRGPGGQYGTGLGLFIVHRLMHLGQGRVSAHSEGVGQGAHFVLTLPAAQGQRS